MTDVVNERLSDTILNSLNRLHVAKINGALSKGELAKIITLEGKLFSNQVKKGLKTEDDVDTFETQFPNGEYRVFDFDHEGLDVAFESVKQENTVALLAKESWDRKSEPVKRM